MQVQKTPIFQKDKGLQHNGFFINLCFAKCEKLSFFGAFLPIFLDFQQNTVKIGISTHFHSMNLQKNGIFGSYYLVQVGSYYLVQVGCVLKNANLDQIITSNRAKLGPDNDFTTYIYMLWSYYLVQVWGFLEVIIWSKLGFWKLLSGPSLCF